MNAKVSVEDHLKNVRDKLGEEHYRKEVRRLAKAGIRMGGQHEIFWRNLTKDFEWLDLDQLLAEPDDFGAIPGMPSGADPSTFLLQAMRQYMPGLKTQAQFNTFREAFDALRLTLNFIFEDNAAKALEARKALDLSLEAAAQATLISNHLRDVPEAATSKAAAEFKNPPSQVYEFDIQKILLTELAHTKSPDELAAWYLRTKEQRDQVVSQTLRNVLMDEIRRKKLELEAQ